MVKLQDFMLTRIQNGISYAEPYVTHIASGLKTVLSYPFALGRIAASAGSAIFSSNKLFELFPGNNATINTVYQGVSLGASTTMTIIRSFAMIRSGDIQIIDDALLDIEEQNLLVNVVNNDDAHIDIHPEDDTPSCKMQSMSLAFRILINGSSAISSLFVLLGSYNNGKSLCNYIASEANLKTDNDIAFYLIEISSGFLALSGLFFYLAYNARAANKNCESIIQIISKNESLVKNKCAGISAFFTASLGMATNLAFNYISTISALAMFKIEIPALAINIMCGANAGSGLINDCMTLIPSLYKNFDELSLPLDVSDESLADKQAKKPAWATPIKIILYPFGIAETVMTGVQSYTSIVLAANKTLGISPYAKSIMGFGIACSISRSICHFSFNVTKSINDFIELDSEIMRKWLADRKSDACLPVSMQDEIVNIQEYERIENEDVIIDLDDEQKRCPGSYKQFALK